MTAQTSFPSVTSSRAARSYRFDDAAVSGGVQRIFGTLSRVPSGVRQTVKHNHARRERAISRQFCRLGAYDQFGDE